MSYRNIEDRRKNKREYYLRNHETIRTRASEWNKKNREHIREASRQRYIRRQLEPTGNIIIIKDINGVEHKYEMVSEEGGDK